MVTPIIHRSKVLLVYFIAQCITDTVNNSLDKLNLFYCSAVQCKQTSPEIATEL